jgi:hypothetical protein
VASVFAKMAHDAVCSSQFHNASSGDRVRIHYPTGLSYRGNMVNIDTQPRHKSS